MVHFRVFRLLFLVALIRNTQMRNRLDKTGMLLVLLGSGLGSAHSAALSGVVTEEGVPLTRVEMLLVDAENNVVQDNAYSDANGGFSFSVEPGVFNLGAFRDGYAVNWRKGIEVGEADVSLQIELTPEAFAEEPDSSVSEDCD